MIALPALIGALGWTLVEYCLHRWGAHEGPNRLRFRREHLQHHGRRDWFAPTPTKLAAAAQVLLPMAAVGAFVPGGLAFTAGFGAMYATYEIVHRRLHTHPPRGPWSAFLRRHHFLHHFHDPRRNHGVTSAAWDRVFGTRMVHEGPVRVPEALAPAWLLEGRGAERWRAGYELRLRAAPPTPDGGGPRKPGCKADGPD